MASWFQKPFVVIHQGGFQRSPLDHFLFIMREEVNIVMMVMYVDDIVLASIMTKKYLIQRHSFKNILWQKILNSYGTFWALRCPLVRKVLSYFRENMFLTYCRRQTCQGPSPLLMNPRTFIFLVISLKLSTHDSTYF